MSEREQAADMPFAVPAGPAATWVREIGFELEPDLLAAALRQNFDVEDADLFTLVEYGGHLCERNGRAPVGEEGAALLRRLEVVAFSDFAQVDEPSARPLLGTDEDNVLPAGGTLVLYGDGGTGKTSKALDAVAHMASATPWLGLAVPAPVRVLVIENEGPRGLFRKKLRAKADAWEGPPFEQNVSIATEPWAQVTFGEARQRADLAEAIVENETDLLVAGPVSRLGMKGGGTLEEVAAFAALVADLRAAVGRPLAVWLVHHENKAGEVSGAWEGEPDTLVHVRRDGRDRSIWTWQKTRWAPAVHGRRWTLRWLAGERYDVVDRGEHSDATRAAEQTEALEWLAAYVEAEYAKTGAGVPRSEAERAYQDAHGGKGRNRARRAIDAQLELAEALAVTPGDDEWTGESDVLLARGPGETRHGVYLYPFGHAPSPLAATPIGETGESMVEPPSGAPSRHSPTPYRGGERSGEKEGGGGEIDLADEP